MKLKTEFVFPPIPVRNCDWSCIDEDTYDGAPDSSTRNDIGWGATEAEAIADFHRLMEEKRESQMTEEEYERERPNRSKSA